MRKTPKKAKASQSETDIPTLFDLGTVATKSKATHPDELDTVGDDFPHQRQCSHKEKMTTRTGWMCHHCYYRWEDASEDWTHARLQSLNKMKLGYLSRMGEQSPATIKRYKEAIAQVEEEEKSLKELLFGSPVSSPVVSLCNNGRTTGELIYQWCEEYLKKSHLYLRYCYAPSVISPAKKLHVPGGNTSSPKVQDRRRIIESAISNGKSPAEIVDIIRGFT